MEQVKSDIEVAIKFCSQARLTPYIQATKGDYPTAIKLCKWNHEFAGTVHQQIGYVEIAVRNAIDRSLRQLAQHETGDEAWTKPGNEPTLVYKIIRSSLETARNRAANKEHKVALSHEDVVANLMWGTWIRLIGKEDTGNNPLQRQLWETTLNTAFPNASSGEKGRQQISRNLCYLRDVRNRAAHFDNLREVATHKRHIINASLFLLHAIDDDFTYGWFDPSSIRKAAKQRDVILTTLA